MRQREANGGGESHARDYSASHGFIVDLVHKVFNRVGSQPLLRRLLHSGRGLASADAQQKRLTAARPWVGRSGAQPSTLTATMLLSGAPSIGESPSLLSGFNAFLASEQRGKECIRGARSPLASPTADNVPLLELSPEEFDAMLQSTPPDVLPSVLTERRSEYGEHLRRLERARKELMCKLADLDGRILRAVAERKDIDDRLRAIEGEKMDGPHEEVDRTGSQADCSSRRGGGMAASKEAGMSAAAAGAKTVVEDVSDESDDADCIAYQQDDAPRLRRLDGVFCGHYGAVTAVDSDSVLGLVASGSLDTQVRIWDTETGECKHTISGHSDIVRQVQFHDRFLLTASNDCHIRMWDLSLLDSVKPRASTMVLREEYVPGSQQCGSTGSASDAAAAGASPDTDGGAHTKMTLESTTPPMTPTIFRYMPPLELCCENTLIGHADAVTCFQATGDTLISGSADKTVREWDLVTGAMRQTIDVTWAVRDSLASRVGSIRPPASRPRPASTWGAAPNRGAPLARPSLPFGAVDEHPARGSETGNGGFIGALQFYEFALATGSADGCLRLWDLRTTQAHRQMHGHTQPVTSLHFDDRSVVTGSLDGTVILWDLRTGHILQRLELGDSVTSVQLRQRGAGGAASYDVECWAAAQDPFLHRYMANSMQRVRYASDHGQSNTRRSQAQIAQQSAGDSAITRIRCRDESTMVTGDASGIVKVWHI
ncbi:Mitochondrial fission protein [Coemansia biformis]|uniref:Mitochondrial fission protein n=1 Tax=Coemansia biformis TaxID=1286918 RepID=A0A9W7YER2_9FUNG|nr:Mitochondrial fission protein [Coemansia biformis]